MFTCSRLQRAGPKVLFAALALAGTLAVGSVGVVHAAATADGPGVVLPKLDPKHGRALFGSKGCVVCHAIHGVGGTDAAPLDASEMDPTGNPFTFFARMWAGMQPMLAMQKKEIGHQIEMNGAELGDLVAFIHDGAEQKMFSLDDVPENIRELLEED